MRVCSFKERISLLDVLDIESLNDLYSIEIDQTAGYSKIVFSIFDHWLNEDEAEFLIVLYNEENFMKDNKKKDIYFSYEKAFLDFYITLYNKYKIYLSLTDKRNTLIIEFDSLQDFIHHISLMVREELFPAIIIPDLNSVIFNWFDFTHCVYVKESTNLKSNLNTLKKLINDSELQILPSKGNDLSTTLDDPQS